MNRNVLNVVVAALVVAVAVLGYLYYKEQQKPEGIKIELGEKGLSVETQ
ncbi:hypothetical protein [Oricola sp.]|nr:hypothetical protein [Ahrensia sp.]MCK5748454.1 hypothetical protein [Oricola sp.]|tara:strand:+ start:28018 stop:28164 length:147 start_codon:yes stop_codon:yes gene_type:complete